MQAVAAPTITGKAKVGKKLTARGGTWALPATAVRYQWLRSGSSIAGATGATYKFKKKDQKKKLSVRVTAVRAGYPSGTAVSKTVKIKTVKK